MSTITLKLQKTDSDFLDACASKIYDVNGNDFYHIPFWFEKIGNGLFVQYGFDDLPKELINRIKEDRGCKEEVNESKPTEQFQWTENLAKELCEYVGMRVGKGKDIRQQIELLTEDFKQSKSKKEEPQWEILSFRGNIDKSTLWVKLPSGRYSFFESQKIGYDLKYMLESVSDGDIKIESVKRFPDNTVWSVGQVTGQGKIKKFQVIGENMLAEVYEMGYTFNIDLLTEAPKEEQVPIKVTQVGFIQFPLQITNHHYNPLEKDALFIQTTSKIPHEKYESIKSAIEDVLNEETLESINKKYFRYE